MTETLRELMKEKKERLQASKQKLQDLTARVAELEAEVAKLKKIAHAPVDLHPAIERILKASEERLAESIARGTGSVAIVMARRFQSK